MKLEVVTDASGLPLGMATAAANVSEQALLVPALDDVPVAVPEGTPVVADKGHDSDPLRDDVEAAGFVPVTRALCCFMTADSGEYTEADLIGFGAN